jgi:hypothetical protein
MLEDEVTVEVSVTRVREPTLKEKLRSFVSIPGRQKMPEGGRCGWWNSYAHVVGGGAYVVLYGMGTCLVEWLASLLSMG